jgi:hypothetical protein
MRRFWSLIRGATIADFSVSIAVLALVAALLYPTWTGRAFRGRVASAIADVDVLGAAARVSRDVQGRWPTAAEPGQAPPELSSLDGPDGPFSGTGYTLAWTTWEVVDSVEAPPDPGPPPAAGDAPRVTEGPRMLPVTRAVGAVGVHSAEESLLAELLEHYGTEASLVVDTIWLLLLPERSPGSAPGP